MTEFGKQHCLEKVGEVCYQHVQFPTKKSLYKGHEIPHDILCFWGILHTGNIWKLEAHQGPNLLGVFRKTCLLMAFLFFLPWLLIFIPLFANEDVDWYKDALLEGVHM